jgi:acyl transferase domain-containing protein/NADP-dependent 3-hydroxy acid dehydrogenase YdfG/acyl carrier protein
LVKKLTLLKKPGALCVEESSAIAIIGMAFRFPGDLADETSLWAALKNGRDLVTQVQPERWATTELQHPRRAEPGRSITFKAGVLSGIDQFDADFFGISPREAAWLDPQQRLLLELAWEAIENGGRAPSTLKGSDCAVYVGISGLDYGTRGLDDLALLSAHFMSGNTLSVAANRLSYFFDLRGPSVAVDTACSSSLVALHHACNSLRTGESSMALVGGVNLLLHPYPFVGFTKASMLSASGRCRAFDAAGDGYVRAEGGAVLLIKPLARALADGDNVHAVIRATGINADGARKTGITIPSSEGQADLMRAVLKRSGLGALDVDFVEAHGTGTAVGDPVEAAAIGAVYGQGRPASQPLPIGSVKTNLGHLEPASGMAGLVKAMLVLKNRAVPPSLHVNTLNPNIGFAALQLDVVTRHQALVPAAGKALVAGVNSFGFGGANAHVLLQEHLGAPQPAHADGARAAPPLFLSARTDAALRELAGRYAQLLEATPTEGFYDIAHAAAHRRERMEKRLAIHSASPADTAQALAQFAQGASPPQVVTEAALPTAGSVAFIYSGNGAQWTGMGRALLAESARFADLLAALDVSLYPHAGFSVVDELREGSAARLEDTTISQPLLFAMQVALTLWLREQGIVPAAVAGHSVGEVAAAWAAGALDLDQSMRVICARSAAQGLTRGTGRMAAVAMSAAAMQGVLSELAVDVEIAGVNSPSNVTISGSLSGLERVRQHLEGQRVFFRQLDLDYAFHSRQMDPIQSRLARSLAGLSPSAPGSAAFISSVTGDAVDDAELDAYYWWRNVREPVRMAEAMSLLVARGCRVFVEIGPHAVLQRYIGECLAAADATGRALPTLRRNDDGLARLEEVALRIHLLADQPQLSALFPWPAAHVRLPSYPWQRERHWHPVASEGHGLIERRRVHPLLGWRLTETPTSWENILDAATVPWLADHQIGAAVVLPGAAYAEMALAAAREWLGGERFTLEELDIVSPIVFDADHARTLRFALNARDGGFQITSRERLSNDDWTLNATGRLLDTADAPVPSAGQLEPLAEASQLIEREAHYRLAASLGLDYGPAFRGLAIARWSDDRLDASVQVPDSVLADGGYLLHPALLDVCFQTLVDFFQADIEAGNGVAMLPVRVGRLDLFSGAPITGLRVQVRRRGARSVAADFELHDAQGQLVARLAGCRFRAAHVAQRERSAVARWHIQPRLRPHPADQAGCELPAPAALAQRLRKGFAGTDAEPQRAAWFTQTLPLFEALTLSFAHAAFNTLFAQRPDWLQQQLNDPDASPYLRWMAARLSAENLLVESEGIWRLEITDLPRAEDIWQELLRDAPACLPTLVLLGRVGRHLPELLSGEHCGHDFQQSLQRSPMAETLLDDDPCYLGTRLAIQSTVLHLAHEWPAHRRLRVLEVAFGASDLTRSLADAVPEGRLECVIAQLHDDTRLRQQLEFGGDPTTAVAAIDASSWQLSAERPLPALFDVVVLRHVLHRALSPSSALAQARRWLAPGGLLLVAERHADWSADILHGLDPAWWHGGADQPLSSLLSPAVWQGALADAGFEAIELACEPAAEDLRAGAYLLLARKSVQDAATLSAPSPARWLLLADGASAACATQLRRHLESWAQQVTVEACAASEHSALSLSGVDHVVHLLGWGGGVDESLKAPVSLLQHVRAMAQQARAPHLWLITQGGALVADAPWPVEPNPLQAALWGLGRVVMNEHPELSCSLIDIACDLDTPHSMTRLAQELLQPDGCNEVVLAAESRYSLSLLPQPEPAVLPGEGDAAQQPVRSRLDFQVPGQLRNLVWLSDPERSLQDHEIEVRPHAVGLNFRDVMYLMGLLPDEAVENGFAGASLGLEMAGVVSRVGRRVKDHLPGDAVMGFGSACFASHVVTRDDAVVAIPPGWSFEAAATVPTVFFTVYHSLKHLADLQPGERVLIHGGAGGVGIAAIQLARHLGAEVYATAGNEEKRDFVRLLGADHVYDSRGLGFADELLAATGGEGVDVVLNSLAGEAIRRNLRVLKPFGRFLELGKRDFFENTPIGLRPFKDNISYFGIDADQLLTGRPALAARMFRDVMALLRDGVLSPLPCRTFPAARVVDAFRTMQQARHIGKVVVSMAAVPRPELAAQPKPVAQLQANSTWLVSGGLSGFGLESARWLADRGVRHLVLLGRRGLATPGAAQAVAELKARGVLVWSVSCDITNRESLGTVIERVRKRMPPLKGVLHAAAVFDDALISRLDAARMHAVLRPKLLGAWHLHSLTLDIPIDHFVVYSSVTTLIGNPGQANYVAANAGLEGLSELRRGMGLPATCIGWGPIGDAGYLSRQTAVKESLGQRLGAAPLSSAQALGLLDALLAGSGAPCAAANFDWSVLARVLPSAHSARFDQINRTSRPGQTGASERIDVRSLIAGKSPADAASLVREMVAQEVAQVLCVAVERVDTTRSLHDQGMDSLMAVELALGLEQRFGVKLPAMMLGDGTAVDRVAARLVEKLLVSDAEPGTEGHSIDSMVGDIARQHGEDATPELLDLVASDTQALVQSRARHSA